MPRLSSADYLDHRLHLRVAWNDDAAGFGALSGSAQRALHDFYAPTQELRKHEALEHRRVVSRGRPSLPHEAGRAYRRIEAEWRRLDHRSKLLASTQPAGTRISSRNRHVTLQPVWRPEPDIPLLVRALIDIVRARDGQAPSSAFVPTPEFLAKVDAEFDREIAKRCS